MAQTTSLGRTLAARFRRLLQRYRQGTTTLGPAVPVIFGVTHFGTFIDGMTMADFTARASRIVRESGRAYRFETSIVLEQARSGAGRLQLLAQDGQAEPGATAHLALLFNVGTQGDGAAYQALPPDRLVRSLLAHPGLADQLPSIRCHATRAVYDHEWALCGPGWHAASGTLVHGPDIQPRGHMPTGVTALDRLPPLCRELLGGFCWATEADLTNALAALLTGFLANHFVEQPKPIILLDGNQPGVGKTLFIELLGRLLDGTVPEPIALTRDEELGKRLGAILREGRSRLFFLDNVRRKLDTELLESIALSPVLAFRLLGQSATIRRPNDYLCCITSNGTTATTDLIDRALPIRLRHEGDPKHRQFTTHPTEFVATHRQDPLGELAGLVDRWLTKGRPEGRPLHRCASWARIVGGILEAAGLDQLLANAAEAVAEMDQGLQDLRTLAEHVAAHRPSDCHADLDRGGMAAGRVPGEWAALFEAAGACREDLERKDGPRAKATLIGTWLGARLDRTVEVEINGRTGTATLKRHTARSNQKRYYFVFQFTETAEVAIDAGMSQGVVASNARPSTGALPEATPEPARQPALPGPPAEVAGPPGNGSDWFSG